MKKSFVLTLILALGSALGAYSQAFKPIVMLMPAEVWCVENGYTTTQTLQGAQTRVPEYERAFQENSDLYNAVTKIGALMTERGWDLKDMAATARDLHRSALEDDFTTSKTSGSVIDETPLEKLMARAKGDILVELAWKINTVGPKRTITYTLRGLDAYTNKQIAAAQGTCTGSLTADVPTLLEESILEHMDNFNSQLMSHVLDMKDKGREVVLNVKVFANSGMSLEDEYNGEELTDIINDWVADNTVNHRYSMTDAGETHASFEQVRIPLYRENGRPMATRDFANGLRKYLGKAPYNIPAKVLTKGLGRVDLILGEK